MALVLAAGTGRAACPSLPLTPESGPPVRPVVRAYRDVVRRACPRLRCRQNGLPYVVSWAELDDILFDATRPPLSRTTIVSIVRPWKIDVRLARADDAAVRGAYREAATDLLAAFRDPAASWHDPLISSSDFAALLATLSAMSRADVPSDGVTSLGALARRNPDSKAPRFAYTVAALREGCRSQALAALRSIPYQQTMPPYTYSYVDAEAIRFAVELDANAFRVVPRLPTR